MSNILQITKTLDFAKSLVRTWTENGVEAFRSSLEGTARLILEQTGDRPADLDTRLGIVVAGVLTVVYDSQPDLLVRRQAMLNRRIIEAGTAEEKITAFVQVLTGFLEELSGDDEHSRLSQRILLFVRSCAVADLRQLSVETLADRLGYNRSYLSRKFKQEQLLDLRQLLLDEKLKRAYEILQSRGHRVSVQALSEQLGFGDRSYFTKLFKEKFGISPGQVT
jgi:AraC-like DNA-binding protein